jgi:two-component system nitrate/nitrite response regulator NarL
MTMEIGGKNRIRLLLADDHPFVIEGLRFYLAAQEQFEIVGEASNGREAIQKARDLQPDIVLLDISMPDMNGLDAAKALCKQNSQIKVLVLSAHDSREYVMQMILCGAQGYVLKDSSPTELSRAIESVYRGEAFFSPHVSKMLLNEVISQPEESKRTVNDLSHRESEVLQMIAEGLSSKEIAFRLGISIRTIETHRERIMQKLDIHNVAGLTKFAIANKLIRLD